MPPRAAFTSRLFQQYLESFQHVGRTATRPLLGVPLEQQMIFQSKPVVTARFPLSLVRSTRPRPRSDAAGLPQRRPQSSSKRSYATKSQIERPSLSQRLKTLSREYGWSALGVYLLLSALDFPLCFAAVRLLGVERIGHYEHVVVEGTKDILKSVWPVKTIGSPHTEEESLSSVSKDDTTPLDGYGVLEAERNNLGEGASIWTQLALAYAIHKSFIFIRVPLTAAVTPKVVKTLRRWGCDIGKRTPKSN